MSTRTNYFVSRPPPLYPLMAHPPYTAPLIIPYDPPKSEYTSPTSPNNLPSPRQRTGHKAGPRGLSIIIPPPSKHFRNFQLIITDHSTINTTTRLKIQQKKAKISRSQLLSSCLNTTSCSSPSSVMLNPRRRSSEEYRVIWEEGSIGLGAIEDSSARYQGLIFVCLALFTLGFTLLVLSIIIPGHSVDIWQQSSSIIH
ncbi:uncharacterized protein L201_007970 [Kwoniella dendrophila CBS 6074]|uniref:Uncharacterized protein n=1 Tax=Kwoniella dendrophila CBS 6074 TaxID=1295534 RepID=A0AAX4K5V5_9TREE